MSTLTQPLGDVTDFAPVDVMADVVTLVLLHVVALGHRHWLTLLSLGVNTDLVATYGVLCLMSTIYLSRDVLTLLPGLLLRHLDTAGLRLRLTNLLRHHPTLLYRLLQAELLWLLYLNREADLTTSVSLSWRSEYIFTYLFLDVKALEMLGHCTDGLGDLMALTLRHIHSYGPAVGHRDVGALLLVELPGDGYDDRPGDVLALLAGDCPADLLLDGSVDSLDNGPTPLHWLGVTLLLGVPVCEVPAD